MIYIKQENETQIVKPTMFPDATSQIWQLALTQYGTKPVRIIWHFEHEAELIWVNQLIALLTTSNIVVEELFIPYLPYARQDKKVSNETTFAKQVFLDMLMKDKVGKVTTIDAHSKDTVINSLSAASYISKAIETFKPEVLVFPDASAYERYASVIDISLFEILVLDKVRNQTNGQITALTLDTENTSANLVKPEQHVTYKMLIIDDICDGGATFINAAIFLHTHYQCEIALYVSHGIFSKGFESLIGAGITAFYTTQSLIKNVTGFKLEELKNDI